jgi:tetratricopeptide (TPR) repeat protein
LAQLQIADQKIDEAVNTYKTTIKDFPDDQTGITSRVQLAKIHMQKEDVESAIAVIEEAAEIAPNDSEVNLVKAKILLINKDNEQAIISLRTVIKDDPSNIEAYFLLAGAHRANNEPEQAKDVIARAYENNRDNIKALLPLAKYHVQQNNAADAEKVVDDYLRLDANNYEALSIKSAILNARKQYMDAYNLAEKMVNLYPGKKNGYIQSVPALLSNNEQDKAIGLLDSGYEKTGSLQIIKLKAQVEIAAKKPDDAIASLGKISEENVDESVQLLLARAYAAKQDIESTKKTLRDSIMEDKTRAQSYISLAAIHASEKNMDQAISVMQEGANANPDDARLGITLAGYYEKAGDIESAIKQYEKILVSKQDNLLANNNLAALLADYRTDEESLSEAKNIADKLKEVKQPVVQDTVGWVYYKTGNYSEAVAMLEQVVAAAPEVDVFNYHLGMAYHKSGDNDKARDYLQQSLASEKEFPGRDVAQKTLDEL